MPLRAPILRLGFAVVLIGCSADTAATGSRSPASAHVPPAQPPQMQAGTSGDFGNAPPPTSHTGSAGAASAPPVPRSNCEGGEYLGTYTCDLEVFGIPASLEGQVSFLLEIDETVVPGECDVEFCPTLVIAEGSGTLYGIAGDTGWAFEGELDGGLDCQTGEFRATAPNGIYGLAGTDTAADPGALGTVLEPPLGEFDGMLSGMHVSGPPERIAGDWDLADAADLARCTGPFTVELQP